MDRRRGLSIRSPSSEEVDYWSRTRASISTLSNMSTATEQTVARVNRLISAWPTDDTLHVDGLESAKTTHKKLSLGLHELRDIAEEEIRVIDDAIERLDVLIALRNASEAPPDKRNKRPRGPSPSVSVLPSPPTTAPHVRPSAKTLPPRNSAGTPLAMAYSREPKSRREAAARQLPLQEGRKVAFQPPAENPGATDDENTWILAVVTKCISADKHRYEVQDAEPQEDGKPGQFYTTTLRAVIPLPDPNVAGYSNAYPEFPAGSTVMALYPDTSCFYRAEVIASPRDMQPSGRGAPSTKYLPTYKLKFEDDDDQEHSVAAQWVVEWPGS